MAGRSDVPQRGAPNPAPVQGSPGIVPAVIVNRGSASIGIGGSSVLLANPSGTADVGLSVSRVDPRSFNNSPEMIERQRLAGLQQDRMKAEFEKANGFWGEFDDVMDQAKDVGAGIINGIVPGSNLGSDTPQRSFGGIVGTVLGVVFTPVVKIVQGVGLLAKGVIGAEKLAQVVNTADKIISTAGKVNDIADTIGVFTGIDLKGGLANALGYGGNTPPQSGITLTNPMGYDGSGINPGGMYDGMITPSKIYPTGLESKQEDKATSPFLIVAGIALAFLILRKIFK